MRRALLIAFLLVGCKKSEEAAQTPPPPTVKVLAAGAVVKQGMVGVKYPQNQRYVLVEAENGSPEPRVVAVEGSLCDAQQKPLVDLTIDELYVPPGERRTFALISKGPAPADAQACVRLRAAPVATYSPNVTVESLKTTPGPAGLGAEVAVQNRFAKPVMATIIVTFFDDKGAILARPFVIENFPPEATRPIFMTGPPGATRAQAFVGDNSI